MKKEKSLVILQFSFLLMYDFR